MTRFAHISDNHLGYRQYHLKTREQDFYDAFQEAVEQIIERDVDFVLHSGDLFNRYRSHPKPIKIAADQFRKLREHGISTYAVPGNHDIALKAGALPVQSILSDLVFTLTGTGDRMFTTHGDIFIGGVRYLPSTYSKMLKNRIEQLAEKAQQYDTRILLLHQGIKRFFPFDYQLHWNDLPTEVFDYIAMGHVHERIQVETRGGGLAYPGSTEVWKKDEISTYLEKGKGFYIVTLANGTPEIETVDLESIRPFLQQEIEKTNFKTTLDDLVAKIRDMAKQPIVFLEVKHVEGRHKVEYYSNRIEKKLKDVTLDYRLAFEFQEKKGSKRSLERKNRKELLSEYFKDQEKAQFAHELLETLVSEGIDTGREKVETFFQRQREDL